MLFGKLITLYVTNPEPHEFSIRKEEALSRGLPHICPSTQEYARHVPPKSSAPPTITMIFHTYTPSVFMCVHICICKESTTILFLYSFSPSLSFSPSEISPKTHLLSSRMLAAGHHVVP